MRAPRSEGQRRISVPPMETEEYHKWLASLQDTDGVWTAGFRTPELTRIAGITYRQADYWARTGVLLPDMDPSKGSGTRRLNSFETICLAALMRQLITPVSFSEETEGGRGLTVEAAAASVALVRNEGRRVCEAAGVLLPTGRGPAVFDGEILPELSDYVVIDGLYVRQLAAAAKGKEICLSGADRMDTSEFSPSE